MKINHNVPLPVHNPRNKKYPWEDMAIGDSLSFKDEVAFYRAVRAAYAWARRQNPKVIFSTRSQIVEGEKSETGGTIWRVE